MQTPRRNVEFKASDQNPERTLRAAIAAGAQDAGWLAQTDTYFHVPQGRLKLREETGGAHLIAYERPDDPTARESRYRLVPADDPAGLRDALAAALGVLVIVKKTRHLLLWQNVRIHLDTVEGLGQFIELEAVAEPTSDLTREHQLATDLQAKLGITPEQIVSFSYSDELLHARGR